MDIQGVEIEKKISYFVNISKTVYRTEYSFCNHFLLTISYVLCEKFKVISGEDFEGVGVFLPNFDATGRSTVSRRPFEPPVFSIQKVFLVIRSKVDCFGKNQLLCGKHGQFFEINIYFTILI